MSLRTVSLLLALIGLPAAAQDPVKGRITAAEAEAPAAREFFGSNGVRIHFFDMGDGEPALLLHGLTGNATDLIGRGVAQGLLDVGYRVIAMDARGHGRSDKPHEPERYGNEMVADVIRLLDHLDIEAAHLVGLSMGGAVANKVRAEFPERLRSVVLAGAGWWKQGGSMIPEFDMRTAAGALREGRGIEPLLRAILPEASDEAVRQQSDLAVADDDPLALAALSDRTDEWAVSAADLRNNEVPTLALIGDLDPIKATVDELASVMPNLQIAVIPGATHLTTWADPMFEREILAFLAEHRNVPNRTVSDRPVGRFEQESAEQRITEAITPLPEALRAGATVVAFGANGTRTVLREGTNHMICEPDVPGDEMYLVRCYHRSQEPYQRRNAELQGQGATEAERLATLEAEVKAGKLAPPKISADYVLLGPTRDNALPITVVYIPYATGASTGLSEERDHYRPWLMRAGTHRAHIMIPGK